MTGVQMGEISTLGWLIGCSSRDMWADSLYFLYIVLGSICRTLKLNTCNNIPSSQTFKSHLQNTESVYLCIEVIWSSRELHNLSDNMKMTKS
jgi:hypothetical protein